MGFEHTYFLNIPLGANAKLDSELQVATKTLIALNAPIVSINLCKFGLFYFLGLSFLICKMRKLCR